MRAALLALHYQNDVLHPDGKIRVGLSADSPLRTQLVAAAQALLRAARERAIPIVHVRVAFREDYADLLQNAPIFRNVANIGAVREGSWGAEFYESLAPREGNPLEFVVTHKRISAFHDSTLGTVLRAIGAQRLIVAGVATHSVVESTVRHAVDIGYEVAVAAEACAAGSPDAHAASLAAMRLIADVWDGPAAQLLADAGEGR